MDCSYIFLALTFLFSPYILHASPWICKNGKFEFIISDTIFFNEPCKSQSEKYFLIQKSIAESEINFEKTQSKRKKYQINKKLTHLRKQNKNLLNYYEEYNKYIGMKYGIREKLSIGIDIDYYSLKSFEKNLNKSIISPNINFNLISTKTIACGVSSKLETTLENKKILYDCDLGFSIGKSKIKKSKKYFEFIDLNLNTNNSVKLNHSIGMENKAGYMGIIATNYFLSLKRDKDIHSSKIRNELFLAKKILPNTKDNSIFIFTSYFNEYSKYSKINLTHGIKLGIIYK